MDPGAAVTDWKDLSPERREISRRRHRRNRKLARLGRPATVPPDAAARHVRILHDQAGMSFKEIADAAPANPETGKRMAQSTVTDLYRGFRTVKGNRRDIMTIPRTTQDRILAVKVPVISQPGGAMVDSTGTKRRLQGLCAAGYGFLAMAEMTGHGHNYLWRIAADYRAPGGRSTYDWVSARIRQEFADFYEKYAERDPMEVGLSLHQVGRAKGAAARNGWAPPSCWDDDTIDNPTAFPEWTGACGTLHGRVVHEREGIPVCQPCRDATVAGNFIVEYDRFDGERFWSLIQSHELTYRELGERVGVSEGSLSAYRAGLRKPTPERLELIATVLGVDPTELVE